jgi:hypothetical protein
VTRSESVESTDRGKYIENRLRPTFKNSPVSGSQSGFNPGAAHKAACSRDVFEAGLAIEDMVRDVEAAVRDVRASRAATTSRAANTTTAAGRSAAATCRTQPYFVLCSARRPCILLTPYVRYIHMIAWLRGAKGSVCDSVRVKVKDHRDAEQQHGHSLSARRLQLLLLHRGVAAAARLRARPAALGTAARQRCRARRAPLPPSPSRC